MTDTTNKTFNKENYSLNQNTNRTSLLNGVSSLFTSAHAASAWLAAKEAIFIIKALAFRIR